MALLRYPLFYCLAGAAAALTDAVRQDLWWGVGILGALISLYGWAAKGPRNEERFEIGDNCYFIGFVYTLVVISLSVGLDAREFLQADAPGGGSPQRLLETVGIALATSVVGMLWRFGLTHGVKTPKNQFDLMVEKTAFAATQLAGTVKRLEEAARQMRDSADAAGDSMRTAEEATAAYSERMRSETGRIGANLTEVAGKLFDDFGNRIADTLHKTQFDEVREGLQSAVEQHREAVSDTGGLLRNSAAVLDGAAADAAAAAKKVDGALRELHDSIAGQLQNTGAAATAAMRAIQDAADEGQTRALAAAEQAEKTEDALRRVAALQRALADGAGEDAARLREMRGVFDSLMRDLRGDSETIIKIKEEYRREFDKAARAALEETNRLYARLNRGAEAALSALENPGALSADLQTIAQHLEEISARLKSPEK